MNITVQTVRLVDSNRAFTDQEIAHRVAAGEIHQHIPQEQVCLGLGPCQAGDSLADRTAGALLFPGGTASALRTGGID